MSTWGVEPPKKGCRLSSSAGANTSRGAPPDSVRRAFGVVTPANMGAARVSGGPSTSATAIDFLTNLPIDCIISVREISERDAGSYWLSSGKTFVHRSRAGRYGHPLPCVGSRGPQS